MLLASAPAAALAQNADGSNATPAILDQLSRAGYEPRTLRVGTTTIASEIGVEARYDSNIYATQTDAIDDVIFIITPRIRIDGLTDRLRYSADVFADFRQYSEQDSENQTTFGIAGTANFTIDRGNGLSAGARFERLAETRNDPEANTGRNLPPRLLDLVSGNLGYAFERGRLGLDLNGTAQHLDYRNPEDAERSLASYYASLRISFLASARYAFFATPYINRRDFDEAVDISGVDRDTTTAGIVGGVRLLTTGTWSGDIGFGAFSANPDDPSLETFSGFAASANLGWSPNPRTVLTLRGSSGDSATVRAGAIGRIDSRLSLRLDQEIRHNLRFTATLSYQKTTYRGLDTDLRTVFAATQVEYLVNRAVALFVVANFASRDADPEQDSFDRNYVGIGIRLRH